MGHCSPIAGPDASSSQPRPRIFVHQKATPAVRLAATTPIAGCRRREVTPPVNPVLMFPKGCRGADRGCRSCRAPPMTSAQPGQGDFFQKSRAFARGGSRSRHVSVRAAFAQTIEIHAPVSSAPGRHDTPCARCLRNSPPGENLCGPPQNRRFPRGSGRLGKRAVTLMFQRAGASTTSNDTCRNGSVTLPDNASPSGKTDAGFST